MALLEAIRSGRVAAGGVPTRVTWHPMGDRLVDWFPDGRSLMVATSMTSGTRQERSKSVFLFHQLRSLWW